MPRSPLIELDNVNSAMERHLASGSPRAESAQDCLANVRNLVEHLVMALAHGEHFNGPDYYKAIKPALNAAKRNKETRFLHEFHTMLQKSVSHYTSSLDGSERLLLKYREYLYRCRDIASKRLGVRILSGLDNVDWDTDSGLQEYYDSIAQEVDYLCATTLAAVAGRRYYVYSRKPFYSCGRLYYEYSLTSATDFVSKFDHVIAFSPYRIPTNYAVSLSCTKGSVRAMGSSFQLMVVNGWNVSIRPCEINKLLRILGCAETVTGRLNSYRRLMDILTADEIDILDLCAFPDEDFNRLIESLVISGKNTGIAELLVRSREFLSGSTAGCNVLRYLLHRPRNSVLDKQIDQAPNNLLGDLRLKNGCIPFDENPFCTSLIGHSPSFFDLLGCINPEPYEDNMLVRAIREKEEEYRAVYIAESDFDSFSEVDALAESFNSRLYQTHRGREIRREMGQCFIREAEDNLVSILKGLIRLSGHGVAGYQTSTTAKLSSMVLSIDDPDKQAIAESLFEHSSVALLYGSAGTGKTTLINIVCDVLSSSRKIAIANTNPAVDNLRRRVSASNCEFMTITKYLHRSKEQATDLLIIDECSTVSNADMKSILDRGGFKILLLVGDTYQIEAIRLGTWFEVARHFLDDKCLFKLERPWRTASADLKALWDSVRQISNDISERLVAMGVSKPLSDEIYRPNADDEIILCLNYDGLYGINNINRMLQAANPSAPISWELHTYKVGDPILFNESNRFAPVLYNNLKGRITSLQKTASDALEVEVEVEVPLNAIEVGAVQGLEYIDSSSKGKTRLRFEITEYDEDENGDSSRTSVVPFQVAYAVSIHKAQGLEYESVKIVVTKDVETRISHSIFYTAITRAKNSLTIYWSPETQERVIEGLSHVDYGRDCQLLANRNGLNLLR